MVALLLEDDAPPARAGLGLNDGMLTDDLADRLSRDPSWQVRTTFANARRELPGQVFDRLSTDRSQAVRDLLAHNPATPEGWWRLLAEFSPQHPAAIKAYESKPWSRMGGTGTM